MAQRPIVNAGQEYMYGLNLDRTDDENITIAAGACRDASNVVDMEVSSALTVDILESGAGGLDTGSVEASKFYAVWLIGDSTRHNSPAGLLSLSFSAPTMPAGYDVKRRVGAVLTDSSSDILEFHQYGEGKDRMMYYDVAISELSNGQSATYAAVDLATSVPPVKCEVLLLVDYTPNSATNKAHILPFASSATNGIVQFGYGVAAAQRGMLQAPSSLDSAVPKIKYKLDNANDSLDLSVIGYIDQL